MQVIFEKFAALIFLFMLVGIVLYFTYVPVPAASEKVILIVIGALMSAATGALPRLFGSDNAKEKELQEEVDELREELAAQEHRHEVQMMTIQTQLATVTKQYNDIVDMLISRHLKPGAGADFDIDTGDADAD